jgi:hypothetical protein
VISISVLRAQVQEPEDLSTRPQTSVSCQLVKFIGMCRKIQKLPNKFCWNLEITCCDWQQQPASIPVPAAAAAAEADPVVPAATAAVPASSSAAAGGTGPEASSASSTFCSTGSTSSAAGSAYSSFRTAGSSIPTGVLSLRRAGTLRQRLSPEGAV